MMERPKYTAPTREWEEYIDRFLSTYPTTGECAIVQRYLQRRKALCDKRNRGTETTAVWRDRALSARRLSNQIIDYKYPQLARPTFKKPKKVKHYYAVVH